MIGLLEDSIGMCTVLMGAVTSLSTIGVRNMRRRSVKASGGLGLKRYFKMLMACQKRKVRGLVPYISSIQSFSTTILSIKHQ